MSTMSLATVVSLTIALTLTPLITLMLRHYQVLDVPVDRSSHSTVTPRGGGIAVAIAAIVAMVIYGLSTESVRNSLLPLLVVSALLAVIGLIDDLRTLEALPRLGAQIVVAGGCVVWALSSYELSILTWLAIAGISTVWLVGFVNAFNFMDGINGISASTAAVTGVFFALIGNLGDVPETSISGIVIAAAAVGFLPHNFPKARVFLGDVGSYFIGGWIAFAAWFAIKEGVHPEAVLAPLTLYLADTSFTLVSRMLRHEAWLKSHREHVYQRLVDLGWSHTKTTLTIMTLTVAISAIGLITLSTDIATRIVADAAIAAIAIAYLASPHWFSRRLRPTRGGTQFTATQS